MKKFLSLFILLIAAQSSLSAEEYFRQDDNCSYCSDCHSYGYYTFGTGPVILVPNIGIGYRSHTGHHGWDACFNFGTIGYGNQLQGSVLYHFVTSPERPNHWYFGAGASSSLLFGFGELKGVTGIYSPIFAMGKEFSSSDCGTSFIQAKISIPTWSFEHSARKPTYFPLMILEWGSSF